MITVITDVEGAYPDVSDDRLVALVDRLGDDLEFIIVERDDAPGFSQAIKKDGTYTVEFKDGSDEIWQAVTEDAAVVCEALLGWSHDRPGWRDTLTWTSIGRF